MVDVGHRPNVEVADSDLSAPDRALAHTDQQSAMWRSFRQSGHLQMARCESRFPFSDPAIGIEKNRQRSINYVSHFLRVVGGSGTELFVIENGRFSCHLHRKGCYHRVKMDSYSLVDGPISRKPLRHSGLHAINSVPPDAFRTLP